PAAHLEPASLDAHREAPGVRRRARLHPGPGRELTRRDPRPDPPERMSAGVGPRTAWVSGLTVAAAARCPASPGLGGTPRDVARARRVRAARAPSPGTRRTFRSGPCGTSFR